MGAARARFLVAALWVGSLWTVGYMVAPVLFATIAERTLAGTIAGTLFRIEAWLSVVCAVLLVALSRGRAGATAGAGRRLRWLAFGMLACTLIGYFGLQPFMASLREAAGPGGVMEAAMKTRFGLLHGIASGFYLLQSLLGVALLLMLPEH